MESFLYTLDEDLFDLYDTLEYSDDLGSPCSNESDQENQQYLSLNKKSPKVPVKKVQQRRAANIRERRRMKSINDAFDNLRSCIPATVNVDRRLSKVDTLRLAIRYISYLSGIVQTCDRYNGDNQFNRHNRPQEKVILRCHFSDSELDENDNIPLLGHSLSWTDEKIPIKSADNKLTAKLWYPERPTEADLLNLAMYSSDVSGNCP
ncbi:hypothetical protein CHS0354_017841 [Potamilus streckersoni]|uniref:BHLH domain-containing protein n=1 Tax=Potamilus streckersoni TaxID=2493646 RepID=A0AAE0T7J6_9BIVA|nr:hypothetical protein CHS0354_017841 [Potamilus streckersoni]